MDAYQLRLDHIRSRFLTGDPADLFEEALRECSGDEDACWEEQFDLTLKYIHTLERYVRYLEREVRCESEEETEESEMSF